MADLFHSENGRIHIYVDGSYRDGYGGIGVFISDHHSKNVSERVTCENNHVAELKAALKAVEIIRTCQLKNVIIYTDSDFVVNGAKKGDNCIDENQFALLVSAMEMNNITIKLVKAHSGVYGNVEAHKLAKAALG